MKDEIEWYVDSDEFLVVIIGSRRVIAASRTGVPCYASGWCIDDHIRHLVSYSHHLRSPRLPCDQPHISARAHLGHSPLDRVPRDDQPILPIRRPVLQKLPRMIPLQHLRRGHHDARSRVFPFPEILDVPHVFERKGVIVPVPRETGFDVIVHRVDVGPIDLHTAEGETGGVVDGDIVEFRVIGPVFVED